MAGRLDIAIHFLPHGEGLALPAYQSAGAAGMDLAAALSAPQIIRAGGRALLPAGFIIALPEHYEAQIRPRSGLAVRHGLTVLNAPGTIDSDYRGEIKVLLANLGAPDVMVKRGERIAQMVIAPVVRARWRLSASLPAKERSERGSGGFGSTGGFAGS